MDETNIEALALPSADPALDPRVYFARLLDSCPEFAHLKDGEANVAWFMRADVFVQAGRMILGMVHLPKVQGRLNALFLWMLNSLHGSQPDFIVILDAVWWGQASEREREILVYHETCHMIQAEDKDGEPKFDDDTGRPVFALAGHDVEEFSAVVRRYGAWNDDILAFQQALQEGNDQ